MISSRSYGIAWATVAIVAHGPRLLLAFLDGDGAGAPPALRTALLATSAVAMALALTGGQAYLAAAVGRGGRYRVVLGALWVGSGREYALGAGQCLAGSDAVALARTCVQVAARYDVGTGGEMRIWRLKPDCGEWLEERVVL